MDIPPVLLKHQWHGLGGKKGRAYPCKDAHRQDGGWVRPGGCTLSEGKMNYLELEMERKKMKGKNLPADSQASQVGGGGAIEACLVWLV